MSIVALITWILTASFGLYLLSIWLIEYDSEYQASAATRLPPLVLASHVLFAVGGLIVWGAYLLFDADKLAWTASLSILLAASLGTTMAVRWVGVYRAGRAANTRESFATPWQLRRARQLSAARQPAVDVSARNEAGAIATMGRPPDIGPPERNFPLPVVVAHGAFAVVTIVLVVLTVLGVGGS
jgi:hypothetical protein